LNNWKNVNTKNYMKYFSKQRKKQKICCPFFNLDGVGKSILGQKMKNQRMMKERIM